MNCVPPHGLALAETSALKAYAGQARVLPVQAPTKFEKLVINLKTANGASGRGRVTLLHPDHIVRRERAADALERKIADQFDGDSFFNCHQHPRTDENLTGLGLVA